MRPCCAGATRWSSCPPAPASPPSTRCRRSLLDGPDRRHLPAAGAAAGPDRRPQRPRRRPDRRGPDQLGRDAGRQQQAALDAVRDGQARFLFITPEQLAQPARLAAGAGPAAGPGRGRRGALPVHLGPRLPARLPDPRPGASPTLAPSAGPVAAAAAPRAPATARGRADRDRVPAGPRGHRGPAAAWSTRGRGHRARPAQPAPRGEPVPDRGAPLAAPARAAARPSGAPASSTCRPGGRPRSSPSGSSTPVTRRSSTTAAWPPGSASAGTRSSSPTEIPDHGGDLGVRHGHRQAEHPLGGAHGPARLARQLPAGDRPGRPRRQPVPGAAAVPARGRGAAALLQLAALRTRPRSATWSRSLRERPHTRAELRERSGLRRPQAHPAAVSLLEEVGAVVDRRRRQAASARPTPRCRSRRPGWPWPRWSATRRCSAPAST